MPSCYYERRTPSSARPACPRTSCSRSAILAQGRGREIPTLAEAIAWTTRTDRAPYAGARHRPLDCGNAADLRLGAGRVAGGRLWHPRGLRAVFRKRNSRAERLIKTGAKWKPYRSVASWYLWRAADLAKSRPPVDASPIRSNQLSPRWTQDAEETRKEEQAGVNHRRREINHRCRVLPSIVLLYFLASSAVRAILVRQSARRRRRIAANNPVRAVARNRG